MGKIINICKTEVAMKTFRAYIEEEMPAFTITEATRISNTDAADVNEIMLGYHLAGNWNKFQGSSEAKAQYTAKSQKIGETEAAAQSARAEIMAKEVIAWSKKNGYTGKVKTVWWTARPGILSKAVGIDVDSRKNPTDVLIQFSDGEFLGVSAKSTKTSGDIGFKNPGIGTVSKNLNIDLSKFNDDGVKAILKEFPKLSAASSKRKGEIRADAKIKNRAEEIGSNVLNSIRDELLKNLAKKNDKDIKDYLLNDWMDAKSAVYPRYVKVTGMKGRAVVEDPMSNTKTAALSSQKVSLSKVGNDSIGVMAGKKRIMKMRAKFESQKLASSVKFSGDPWK